MDKNKYKMKYTIYEMIQPDHLKDIVRKAYGCTKTIYRDVLEKLDIDGVECEHLTLESAMSEIVNKKDKLKHLRLTIIPIVEVSFDGSINGI